jgi:uncharacterized protein with PhoU and TrkA domain
MSEIINAKNRDVSDAASDLPNVVASVQELMRPVVGVMVESKQVAGRTKEVPIDVRTQACIQPYTPQQLIYMPEGIRKWKWYSLWTMANMDLEPDDVFIMKGVRYRIKEKEDWQEYGYFKYAVIEDFQDTADVSQGS